MTAQKDIISDSYIPCNLILQDAHTIIFFINPMLASFSLSSQAAVFQCFARQSTVPLSYDCSYIQAMTIDLMYVYCCFIAGCLQQ